MEITFLRSLLDKSKVTFDFFFPLFQTKRYLYESGYKVKIADELNEAITQCDVLCILSSCVRYHRRDPAYQDRLKHLISVANKVYFFDIADSGGGLYWDYLGTCDRYYKKQIYRNRRFYVSNPYDSRMHFNYYHEHYGCEFAALDIPAFRLPEIKSIKLSWNVGLGDYRVFPYHVSSIERLLRYLQYRIVRKPLNWVPLEIKYRSSPHQRRDIDVMACFSDYRNLLPASLHRKQALDAIIGLGKQVNSVAGFLEKREYFDRLDKTRSAISPFGWGEMVWKDFEMFIRGIALLKPDVSHLDTWPEYFLPGETYIPYRWDASNLASVLEDTLSRPRELEQIARRGQEHFKSFDVRENPGPFVKRFHYLFNDQS